MTRLQRMRSFVATEIIDLGIPEGALSPEDMRRTRVLSITSLLIVGLLGLPFVAVFQLVGLETLTVLLVASMTAAIGNLLVLRARREPRQAAHVGIGILGFQLAVSNCFTGGFYEPNFSWFYLLPLGAAALIDMRGATIWTIATIATTVGFWLLPDFGIHLTSQVPEAAQANHNLVSRVSAIVGVGILAGSFVAGQRRAERGLARANADLLTETAYVQLLMHAAVASNEAYSFESAMRECLQRVCDTMDWVAGQIFVVGEDGAGEASGISHVRDGSLEELGRFTRTRRFAPGEGIVGRAISEREPQIVESLPLAHDPGSAVAIALRSGIRSAMAVPVYVNGRVPAVLLFAAAAPLARTERLLEVFSLIGAQLGKVAERTALQGRVQHSQKMEAVGQLAAGVAHEINNPMSYVRSNLHTLRAEWGELRGKLDHEKEETLADFEELIDESLEGVERTIAIVRDVKDFSHKGVSDPKEWQESDLVALLEGALRVVSTQAPAGVRVDSRHDGPVICRCAPNHLRQVFVNLLVNAIQAVGEAGEIRVSTGVDGDFVFARVEDDGPGIAEAARGRLFDPFFTTKPVGQGTGLGLSVSYEIVRNHGGEIGVESEPGQGAAFEVRLPVNGRPRQRDESSSQTGSS